MALTVNVPAPQPTVLLEPDLSKLEPVYHLSIEEEAAIAAKGVRVMFCITSGAALPLYGMGQKQVRVQHDLFNHLQSMLRSQNLRKYNIECICIPDERSSGTLLALKSVNIGSGPIKENAPPETFHIPDLQMSWTETTTVPRIKDTFACLHDTASGQHHPLSSQHAIMTCVVRVTIRPPNSRQPRRTNIDVCSGRVNGEEIDIKKVVGRLHPYFPGILAYAAANKYQPFAARLDCTKVVGQEMWVLQRWAEPVSVENYLQRSEVEQRARQLVRPLQPSAAGQAAAASRRPSSAQAQARASKPAPATAASQPSALRQSNRLSSQSTLLLQQPVKPNASQPNVPIAAPQVAAGPSAGGLFTLEIRFEVGRDANGNLGLRRSYMDSAIVNVKVRPEHGRQVYACMQAARTSVCYVIFRCKRIAQGRYETVEVVQRGQSRSQ